ncbi:ATP-grasp domain-containing protein [Streptomyces yaanensis]|uniref:ATP-grasp domain-containing protein n=1 Tax=Streptomyces yaanensis TaxID=1142239 RepID=A0ABV7SH05_9ACTN|nr:ATP-grasp domain-containing protein [Streptomyces sp. CGMCC 4.7035]WNB98236.1 ATP-grasp domain-containing protein [Streptomyces sp. CGMCC 4.7035]
MKGSVLVIGSGYQHFREYALRGLAEAFRLVLIGPAPLDWQLPYVVDHRTADVQDEAAVHAAAAALATDHHITGVVTWDESLVTRTAEVAAWLGVPAMPVVAAQACRDKARQRQRFQAVGVPSARFALTGSEAEAVTAAESLGYPVVLKPRGRAASVGVRIVRSEAELRETFARVREVENPSIDDGLVLIEEFLSGPEIAVDSWVLDGRVEPFSIAAKRTDYPPYFEEVAHVVGSVLDAGTEARVREVVIAANRALGTDRTITHTELILTADGPKVVEVNGRLGGDLIPHLAELAVPGLSVGRVLGTVATGRVPEPIAAPDRLVGIRFLYPAADLAFTSLELPSALADEPWTHEVRTVTETGTELRLPPRGFLGRAGYAIATGDDVAEIDARLLKLAEATAVHGEPLPS